MNVQHQLVGYRKDDEERAHAFDLPPCLLEKAKTWANVRPDDPDAVWCYLLSRSAARKLAKAVGVAIDPARNDYFLEGIATDEAHLARVTQLVGAFAT